MQSPLIDVDPFDLPEWLGTEDVVWQADDGLEQGDSRGVHRLRGRLSGPDDELACDLMAVDEAYPEVVTDEATRVRVHHAWRHDQVLVGEYDGRLTLAVPGTRIGPDIAMGALGRLARAVGARPERYAVLLRVAG